MARALIFPGQGAQHVGMAGNVYEKYPLVRERFAAASEISGLDLAKLCFEGPVEQLSRTDVSQPAIFTVSMVLLELIAELTGSDPLNDVKYCAGLSLGEYSALCAAGVFSFETGVDLVSRRGRYMQQAAEATNGSMLALVGADGQTARELCEKASEAGAISPANFNCPGQIVLSGEIAAIDKAAELAEASDAVRTAKKLEVAGAFHSELMASAAENLGKTLSETEFAPAKVPVMSNVTGKVHGDSESVKQALLAQLTGSVLWQNNCQAMIADGCDEFVEIGPGKVLAGLSRRIDRKAKVITVNGEDTLAGFVGA